LPEEIVVAASALALHSERDRGDVQHSSQIDWYYPAGVIAVHLLALLAFLPWFFSWTGVILAAVGIYVFGTLGINIGFHRLLTHRSFSCPRWLIRTLALLGTCCVMESPPYWVAVHRRHHQFADEEWDPHSPLSSFFWAHFGWYMIKIDPNDRSELLQRYAQDVLRDPLLRFLDSNLNWLIVIASSWVAFFMISWSAALAMGSSMADALQLGASVLVWGVVVRTVCVFEMTMCVNSVTHLWGYRTYQTSDNSKNNLWIGILSNGEGWHNNHHAFPRSARHGHYWWELDVAWLTIRLLERIGLATHVVLSPQILAAGEKERPSGLDTTESNL
jgi:fatty-acid desaturase